MRWWLVPLLLVACPGEPDETGVVDTGVEPGEPTFSVLAQGIDGGVLLSAWSDGDDVLMVGGETGLDGGAALMVRYRDGALCTLPSPADVPLWWIHGAAAGEWYAVGEKGAVVHHVGGVSTREDVPTDATLFGVFDAGDEVWVAGADLAAGTGEIWHRDGDGTWTLFATVEQPAFKVWEDWFVGYQLAYHLVDGTLEPHHPNTRILTVRGRAADDVWAVGGVTNAKVLHWEGTEWTEVDNGLGQPLNGLWTAPGEDVWVSGNFGLTAVYDGVDWTMPSPPMTSEHFHAVWKHGDEVLFVGGNLFSTSDHAAVIGRYSVDATEQLTVGVCD
jgi:hypothetical protein